MFTTRSRERFRDQTLRVRATRSRILADITPSAMFTCWGERLLLRMADSEFYRMKRRGATTLRFR